MQNPASRSAGGLGRAPVPALNEVVNIPRELSNRVTQLIQGIRPVRASEQRRHEIADYVRQLIIRCFQPEHKVEAFMFGSVPLRTYLPDGDIDISIFCEPKGLQDTWCDRLSAVLESEADNPDAEFKVANVSLINAEVKLLKCLVDNIVVDVSFNQIGGLCTLNFLEAMDRKIGGKHLFKQSIILIKAWCYYESRVLGAQHSLLSTYALETMVLHIFNVYHSELQTPLEVLYKFLIVFHHFEWENYCLTLSGPVSIKDLDINSVPTPPDQGQMLLNMTFMSVMLDSYSYTPIVPTNSKGPGYPKYMNIMDPLLHSNNLGRSVSKTSEIRIRNAFGYGARLLNQLFKKDLSEAMETLDDFFKNTWLALQRPRQALQTPSPIPSRQQTGAYVTPGAKSGQCLLDLLKDSRKDLTETHDRDGGGGGGAFPIPGFPIGHQTQGPNGAIGMPTSGNLAGIFPPPPPRGPDDRSTMHQTFVGRAELEKLGRQLPAAQHMRTLFDMHASIKNEAGQTFNAYPQATPLDSNSIAGHYAPVQIYNSPYHPLKLPSARNAAAVHLHRGSPALPLQRARSEPNIAECTKKKEKGPKKYQAPYQVQNPKCLPTLPTTGMPEDENKQGSAQRINPPLSEPTVRPSDMTHVKNQEPLKQDKASQKNKGEQQQWVDDQWRERLEFDEDTKRRLDAITARVKAAEKGNETSESTTSESKKKDCPDSQKEKEEKESTKARPTNDSMATRNEIHDQSIVIGEPPEPATLVGEGIRLDRDPYSTGRQIYRRNGRQCDFHPGLQTVDSRNVLIQMAQNQQARQSMGRVAMAERQMHTLMELGPSGELLTSIAPVYHHWFLNPVAAAAAYSQTPMYNILTNQGDHPAAVQMAASRPTGAAPSSGIRHPVMSNKDGRNALVDFFPTAYQQYAFPRHDGSLGVLDRRVPGGVLPTMAPGWNNLYTQVNNGGATATRVHDESMARDSDCVLSGDIETLTQQLEVARNFIGYKTTATTGDKDRNGRSSSSGQKPEKTLSSNTGLRRSTPSPTMSNRQDSRASSRERHGRNLMETQPQQPQQQQQQSFTHHLHGPTGAPVGFPGGFQTQATNLLYPVQSGFIGHPPPPSGVVSADRMSADMELYANGNVNMAAVAASGYSYQGNLRGMHMPLATMNINTGAPASGTMPHSVMSSHTHLPPQPPCSTSPNRMKESSQMNRNAKTGTAGNRILPMEVRQPVSVPTDDGTTVTLDASVIKAVNAAIAEGGGAYPSNHLAAKDPNNQTSPGDPNSPRHASGDELRSGIHDGSSVMRLPVARQLEKGVFYYAGTKELPMFSGHGQILNDASVNRASGSLASLFSSAITQPNDLPQPQQRPATASFGVPPTMESVVQHPTRTTSYGTGCFMSRNRQNMYEEMRLKEQQNAEKESQVPTADNHGGEEASWGNASESTSSDKTEHNENKTHPRGRMTPPTGQQWPNSTNSGRSMLHTPPRGYSPHPGNMSRADLWQSKESGAVNSAHGLDRMPVTGVTNPNEMTQYFKQYGDIAGAFISSDVLPRKTEHGRPNLISHANAAGVTTNQGYGDYPTANGYHAQSLPHRHPSQAHNGGTHSLIVSRNRRDSDRWIHHPRNDKPSVEPNPTSDGLNGHGRMRRGTDPSERWDNKRYQRHPNASAPFRSFDSMHKANLDVMLDDDGSQPQPRHHNFDQFFSTARQSRYRNPSLNQRTQRNRRGIPDDDRNRVLRDSEFPSLESARSSKHASSPSSQSGSPRTAEKQGQPTSH